MATDRMCRTLNDTLYRQKERKFCDHMESVNLNAVMYSNVMDDGEFRRLKGWNVVGFVHQPCTVEARVATQFRQSESPGGRQKGSEDQMAASTRYLHRYQSRSALSITTCVPSPSSECVERPLHGEPLATPGELVPVFGVSKPIGVTEPLGGTGVLMSSGELGIRFSGSSGILILVASLL